jgi:ABC-2 type transport system permease protein
MEWRQGRKAFLWWTGGISLFVLLMMMLYPSFAGQMAGLDALMSGMGMFTKMFGLDKIKMSTLIGFFGIEVGTVLGIGGAMFAAILGLSAVSREENRRTAEFLFSHPLKRSQALAGKLLCMIVFIILMNLGVTLVSWLSFLVVGGEYVMADFLRLMVSQLLLHLQVGLICFGISCFVATESVGVGIGVALMLYILNLMMNVMDDLKVLRFLTPFYYADYINLIGGRLQCPEILSGFALALVTLAAGIINYGHKDLAN